MRRPCRLTRRALFAAEACPDAVVASATRPTRAGVAEREAVGALAVGPAFRIADALAEHADAPGGTRVVVVAATAFVVTANRDAVLAGRAARRPTPLAVPPGAAAIAAAGLASIGAFARLENAEVGRAVFVRGAELAAARRRRHRLRAARALGGAGAGRPVAAAAGVFDHDAAAAAGSQKQEHRGRAKPGHDDRIRQFERGGLRRNPVTTVKSFPGRMGTKNEA